MSGSERERPGSNGNGSGKPKKRTTKAIMPIYARLPKGPHGLGATGVAHNQRIRMHGGMIEAITTRGYEETSVRLVIGLAGVSRRAFYEQFSGKEDCFMATFDLIVNRAVQRLTHAYRTARGGREAPAHGAGGARKRTGTEPEGAAPGDDRLPDRGPRGGAASAEDDRAVRRTALRGPLRSAPAHHRLRRRTDRRIGRPIPRTRSRCRW